MAYRIEYGQPSGKKYPPAGHSWRLTGMICGALVLFLLVTHFLWPEGKAVLEELFLPGDREYTAQVFSAMVEQLREGEPAGQAVTAFCRELLRHDTP